MTTEVQLPTVVWRHIPSPSINSLIGSGALAATDDELTATFWTGSSGQAWLQSSSTSDLLTWTNASASRVSSDLQAPTLAAVAWSGAVYAAYPTSGGPECVKITTNSPSALPTPGTTTTGTPVLTAGPDSLFAIYSASSALWCLSIPYAGSWAGPYKIPGPATSGDPAVATYNGRLHVCFVAGAGSTGQLLHTSSVDGVSWRAPAPIGSPPITLTAGGVGAGAFNGLLYVAGQFTGASSLGYVASADGSTWSDVQPVPGLVVSAGYSPCLASTDTSLYWLAQQQGDATLDLLEMTLD